MPVPSASHYPEEVDTNRNLYTVHDSLRVRLLEDYMPGDKRIFIEGDQEVIDKFPPNGLITLTEQCSDPDERAISLFYLSRTETTFEELSILPGFTDVKKPRKITNVTQNVMADHHNNIKNAVIAVEEFVGVKGTIDAKPFGQTMEGRINFLRKLVLSPKAWFTVNKRVGLVPLCVSFMDLSFRLGTDGTTGDIIYKWNFGDNTSSTISMISATSVVSPSDIMNVIVEDLDGKGISKCYHKPGVYDVTLEVTNDFGTDTVVFPALINARIAAPEQAVMDFIPRSNQEFTAGEPSGGPYTTTPMIRATTGSLIDIEVKSGTNTNTGRSYAGELLDGNNQPVDPIVAWAWSMGDDLPHSSSRNTTATYSIGGVYDLVLRVDTQYGAYRITTYEDCIDIIERNNLWLWTFNAGSTVNVRPHEFGLISETFKTVSSTNLAVTRNSTFLDNVPNATQQKNEFNRNCGFTNRGTSSSGEQGTCVLYWASGRSEVDSVASENINVTEYNGFSDVYLAKSPLSRPWNWVALPSADTVYFLFGQPLTSPTVGTSPTNQTRTNYNILDFTSSATTMTASNYKNGAEDLMSNPAIYDVSGPVYGHMSAYRSCWKGSTGYIVRNDGVGTFFRLRSFYKTESVGLTQFQNIRKLPDMAGAAKLEGQLVPLTNGIFFFNNSGSVSAYNESSGVWETGGPGLNSPDFRALQDASVSGYDSTQNTLLAASDGDRRAYISFDYSPNAFIKFNSTDLTFMKTGIRPEGSQWQMGVW